MIELKVDAPLKTLIEDFRSFEKSQNNWVYKFSDGNIFANINKVFIQGEIIKTAGFSNEILIVDDGTGKAKVTRGCHIPGNLSWVNSGLHCSVIGSLAEKGKLPLIVADKIAKITNQVLLQMWPWEVKELKNVLLKRSFPQSQKEKAFEINTKVKICLI